MDSYMKSLYTPKPQPVKTVADWTDIDEFEFMKRRMFPTVYGVPPAEIVAKFTKQPAPVTVREPDTFDDLKEQFLASLRPVYPWETKKDIVVKEAAQEELEEFEDAIQELDIPVISLCKADESVQEEPEGYVVFEQPEEYEFMNNSHRYRVVRDLVEKFTETFEYTPTECALWVASVESQVSISGLSLNECKERGEIPNFWTKLRLRKYLTFYWCRLWRCPKAMKELLKIFDSLIDKKMKFNPREILFDYINNPRFLAYTEDEFTTHCTTYWDVTTSPRLPNIHADYELPDDYDWFQFDEDWMVRPVDADGELDSGDLFSHWIFPTLKELIVKPEISMESMVWRVDTNESVTSQMAALEHNQVEIFLGEKRVLSGTLLDSKTLMCPLHTFQGVPQNSEFRIRQIRGEYERNFVFNSDTVRNVPCPLGEFVWNDYAFVTVEPCPVEDIRHLYIRSGESQNGPFAWAWIKRQNVWGPVRGNASFSPGQACDSARQFGTRQTVTFDVGCDQGDCGGMIAVNIGTATKPLLRIAGYITLQVKSKRSTVTKGPFIDDAELRNLEYAAEHFHDPRIEGGLKQKVSNIMTPAYELYQLSAYCASVWSLVVSVITPVFSSWTQTSTTAVQEHVNTTDGLEGTAYTCAILFALVIVLALLMRRT